MIILKGIGDVFYRPVLGFASSHYYYPLFILLIHINQLNLVFRLFNQLQKGLVDYFYYSL